MSTDYNSMKYAEVQKLAKERELNASGTKEDIVARLEEADGGSTEPASAEPTEPATDPAEPQASEGAPEAPEETPAPKVNEAAEMHKADRGLREDARKMKAHLDKQPKISIMIPFDVGENAEVAKKVKFPVTLNGYRMEIPRGVYVEVPKQVADVIKERLESEGKIGSQWRIDRDPSKQKALG